MQRFLALLVSSYLLMGCATATTHHAYNGVNGHQLEMRKDGLIQLKYKFTKETSWKTMQGLTMLFLADVAIQHNKAKLFVYESYIISNGKARKIKRRELMNSGGKRFYSDDVVIRVLVKLVDQDYADSERFKSSIIPAVTAKKLLERYEEYR